MKLVNYSQVLVKYNVGQAVIRAKAVISDSKSFYEYCVENLTTRREYFYLNELTKTRPEVRPIKAKVRKMHCVKKFGDGKLAARALSCYSECCINGTICQNDEFCGT